MNSEENEQLQGAMERIRSIENELTCGHPSETEADRDRELELIDDLLTLQMGIGPLRRKHARGDNEKG